MEDWMMLERILRTTDDTAALVLRLVLAVVIFPHGAQKLLGWFGGNGFSGTMDFFTGTMGIPWIFALLVVLAEFFGPLGLVVGLLTRVAAAGIGAVMAGAIFMVHLQHGFFMNWQGNKGGEGFEFHLLVLGIVVALLIKGGGRWSLDGVLARRASRRV
jgi:putative oxidoreductase